jgi:hypothetical protein
MQNLALSSKLNSGVSPDFRDNKTNSRYGSIGVADTLRAMGKIGHNCNQWVI